MKQANKKFTPPILLLMTMLLIATLLLSQQAPAFTRQPVARAVSSPTATMPPATPSATLFRVDEPPAQRPQPSVRTDVHRYRRDEPTVGSTVLPPSPTTVVVSTGPTSTPARQDSSWPLALVPAAIPLAASDPGTWQVVDGSLTYILPEGALAGEGLGSLPVAGQPGSLSIQLTSHEGEDCGLAFGTADRFTLLRLTTGGPDQTMLRAFEFRDSNFAAPTANATTVGRYAGVPHQLTVSNNGAVQLDGQATFSLPALNLNQPLLYASGAGCTFNQLESQP